MEKKAFTIDLISTGDDVDKISRWQMDQFRQSYMKLYHKFAGICNDGLIDKLNDVSEYIIPTDLLNDGKHNTFVERYNHFISDFFEIIARAVNRENPNEKVELYMDRDTAECYGKVKNKDIELHYDWDSLQLEGGETS